jgi:hypothetical protein
MILKYLRTFRACSSALLGNAVPEDAKRAGMVKMRGPVWTTYAINEETSNHPRPNPFLFVRRVNIFKVPSC